MAYFSQLWKARTVEKYRLDYEHEKIKSILTSDTELPKRNFMLKCRNFHYGTKKQVQKKFRQWCPEGSAVSNFFIYLRMDQTFPNFLLKSVIGFVGGIILTYLCFMFFVFQLSISIMHATIMSSVIGILLILGLAFSYRIRCLVFLLIPQFFSRVGRYTLTCYALVLILTGPATNTLKNSEVLSESMACGQEQIKASVRQMNDSYKNPHNLIKDSIEIVVERMKLATTRFREMLLRLNRLILSLVSIFQSMFSWLLSLVPHCNKKFGSPYEKCVQAICNGYGYCESTLGLRNNNYCKDLAEIVCWTVKPFDAICIPQDYLNRNIATVVRKKLRNFSEHIRVMLHVDVHVHHTYSYNSNVSKTASQAAAGIVTEIRNRADPLLTWLSWSSCVTSLFLLLIIFRAKYYQHMFETRSRFDNRYLTKELRELDFKRQKQGRDTILPLNRREKMTYICTTSFQLVPSEKVYISRSAVFMTITTFKLLIHIVADYSLYWILMTIRHHGRFQTPMTPGYPDTGVKVTGAGPVVRFMQAIVDAVYIPLNTPTPMPSSCLPDPIPPDLHRYAQIGVLIFLLWFFALFEPYGLRLRHVIMGMYNPERAKARAAWLYNHILTTRAGFMKYARRKLHRQYKYSSEKKLTFKCWFNSYLPFTWLQALFGTGPDKSQCLLCSTKEIPEDLDTQLISCDTKDCPGVFCVSCFADIGQLCTICLSPGDYGDVSDISLELGSSDDSEDSDNFNVDEDSGDEMKCLLGRRHEDRKLSRSNNNDNQRLSYEMLKLPSPQNTRKEVIDKLHNISKVLSVYYQIVPSNLETKMKVDFNNNVIEYLNHKHESLETDKTAGKYSNFSLDVTIEQYFIPKSNILVFSINQEINAAGKILQMKLKKQFTTTHKRYRKRIKFKLKTILNFLKRTKLFFKNINFSYYCLRKHKRILRVKKITNQNKAAKNKRRTIGIKIVKQPDNILETYLKNLRVLKLVTKSIQQPNKKLELENIKDDEKINDCEAPLEDTDKLNWYNEDTHTKPGETKNYPEDVDESELDLRTYIKKKRSVTWDPINVYDIYEETPNKETLKVKKFSQATQTLHASRCLRNKHFHAEINHFQPSHSKSTTCDGKQFQTCTCATQHRKIPRDEKRRLTKHIKKRTSPERKGVLKEMKKQNNLDQVPGKEKRRQNHHFIEKEKDKNSNNLKMQREIMDYERIRAQKYNVEK